MNSTNQCSIVGVLTERSDLRYTPAGIPIVTGVIAHQSEQHEAGNKRRIECEIPILVAGEAVDLLMRVALGETCLWYGFLNRKTRNSPRLILHVTDVQMDVSGCDPLLA